MKFLKKLTVFCLVAIISSGFAACGDEKKPETEPSSSQVSSSDPSIPQLSGATGVEITPNVEKEKIWGGKAAEKITLGGGTEEYPYLIQTPAELAYAFSIGGGGAYYKLTSDIYLNDVSDDKWYEKKDVKSWYEKEFKGHIDGDGHCVYGVYFDSNKPPRFAGLICTFMGGSVKNLGVRKSRIIATMYAGGIVGMASGDDQKVFENCFADETVVSMYTQNGTNGAGGILGYAAGGGGTLKNPTIIFKNCYSKAKLGGYDTEYRLNGIIGTSWDCGYTMENCYSVGFAAYRGHSDRAASTILQDGTKADKVYKNIYNDLRGAANLEVMTKIETSKMNGAAAKSYFKGFDFEKVWETVSGGTPKLKIFKDIDGKNIKTPDAPTVQVVNKLFESGSGTKADPYVIINAQQFKNMMTANTADSYYKLGQDIYANNVNNRNWKTDKPEAWLRSGSFKGNFDGCGHSVYGLYVNEIPAEGAIINGNTGLFPRVETTAVIRNVHLKESYICGKAYVGGIVGSVNGSPTEEKYALITGCTVDETVHLSGQTVGGILGGGHGGAAIAYCSFTGTIDEFTGGSMRGNGIVGDIWSKNYKLAECFTLGYTVYRGQFLPKVMGTVYSTEEQKGVLMMSSADILGAAAKTAMPGLNWRVWKTSSGKNPTPALITEKNDYKF